MSPSKKEEDIVEVIRKKLEAHKRQESVKSGVGKGEERVVQRESPMQPKSDFNQYLPSQSEPIPQEPKEVQFSKQDARLGMQSSPAVQVNESIFPNKVTSSLKEQPPAAVPSRAAPYPPGTMAEVPKRKKGRLILIILIIIILLLIALLIIYLLFFMSSSERELNSSENIEKAVVLENGEALIELEKGVDLDLLREVQIIFSVDDAEYLYNPEYISREYNVHASDLGLENFDDVTSVRAIFGYKHGEPNGTVVYPSINQSLNQTSQNRSVGGGGGGGGGGGDGCKPDCVGKQCGSDGCGGTCSPGCSRGYSCASGKCLFIEGLVSYWKFEGDSNDSVGRNNGTINGASLIGGVNGQAYSFDGVDDYINISGRNLEGYEQMSISWWAKYPEPANDYEHFFSKYGSVQWVGSYYASLNGPVYGIDKGKISMFFYNDTSRFKLVTESKPAYNVWHYFVAVYDSINQTAKLYVDAALSDQINVNGRIQDSESSLTIGCSNNIIAKAQSFNGTIDEVKIWNRSLTSDDVLREYWNTKKDMPVSYWSFEGDAHDSIGINHGIVNGASLTRGILGQAYDFNGSNYIDFGNQTSLDFGPNNFTIGAWIKANSSGDRTILAKRETSESYWHFRVYGRGNQLALLTNNGAGVRYHQSNLDERLYDGYWHYITVVRDSGNKVSFYIDSSFLSSVSDEGQDTSNNQSVLMGAYTKTGEYPFNGTIDEVKIWNRSLIPEEILREYEGTRKLGLIAYWKFDGDTKDSIGRSEGIVYGNPVLTQGILGQAYNFDGIDDFIEMPSSGIDLDYKFSVSAWVYLKPVSNNYPGIFWKNDTLILRYCPAEVRKNEFQGFIRIGGDLEPRVSFGPYTNYNKWYHLVMTYDSSEEENNLKLYVNGSLVSAATRKGPMDLSKGNFYVGRYYSVPAEYFNGTIDEVKVWNYDLSAEEIRGIYESQKPMPVVPTPTLSPFARFWEAVKGFFS